MDAHAKKRKRKGEKEMQISAGDMARTEGEKNKTQRTKNKVENGK